MRSLVLLLMLALLAVSPAFASDTAKTLGMSGAVVAVDDLSAPIYNPALLAKMDKMQLGVSMSYVRQTLDFTSTDPTFDGLRSDASQVVILDNLGFTTAGFGPGTLYAGFNTDKRYLSYIKDFAGATVFGETTMYSPTVAYGMKVDPRLSIGASLIYNYKFFSARAETDSGRMPMWEISRSLGLTLGALYALNPQIDLGASLSLLGASSVTGYADITDLGNEDYVIGGNHPNPSTMRLGASYRPRDNVTLGLQFDIINGFAFTQKEDFNGDTHYEWIDATVKADTVIATRLGAEYVLPAKALRLPLDGTVPLRAGVCFIPDNKVVTGLEGSSATLFSPILDAASYLDVKVPNTASFTLGVGYNTDLFELGASAIWATCAGDVLFDDDAGSHSFTSIDKRGVISAKFWI